MQFEEKSNQRMSNFLVTSQNFFLLLLFLVMHAFLV